MPTSQTLTQRLFLEYTSQGIPHTLCFRFSPPAAPADLPGYAQTIAQLYAAYMLNTDSFFRASYASVGSNVQFPIAFSAQPGANTAAGNIFTEDPQSVMISMTGKDTAAGFRWSTRFFTAYNNGGIRPDKNRYLGDAISGNLLGWYSGVIGLLAGTYLGVPRVVGVNGASIIFNAYVNISNNGYVQRKQRRT